MKIQATTTVSNHPSLLFLSHTIIYQ